MLRKDSSRPIPVHRDCDNSRSYCSLPERQRRRRSPPPQRRRCRCHQLIRHLQTRAEHSSLSSYSLLFLGPTMRFRRHAQGRLSPMEHRWQPARSETLSTQRLQPLQTQRLLAEQYSTSLNSDCRQRRSMMVTFAWPPPSHIVWRPNRPLVRSSSLSSVTIRRAPVAPRG